LQVTSRVSLGRRFGEESFLEALTHSKSLFPLPYILCCHFIWFSANILVLERSLNIFYLSSCWLENFCVYTEIFHHFSWCFAAFSASFSLLILQGSVIFWKLRLHTTPRRPPSLLFLSLGNISPLLSHLYLIFWSFS